MTKRPEQSRWSRLLRTTAHLSIATMWFITLAAYLPDLLQLSIFETNNVQSTAPVESQPMVIPNSAIVVAAIGGLLIVVLVFLVIKRFYIPATDKAVERMTETAQKQILITLQKREPKVPKKEKQQISRYAVEAVYLLLIAVPLLVIFVGQPIQTESIRILVEFALSVLALYATVAVTFFLHNSKISKLES